MSGEKTEKPTPKKRQELRKKGVVARSMELPQGVSLVALVAAVPMAARRLAQSYRGDMTALLSSAGTADLTAAGQMARAMLTDGVKALALPVLLVMGATLLTNVMVTRERPNLLSLKPKFTGLNPKNGVKRLFGKQGLVDAVRAFLKLAVLTGVGYSSWHSGLRRIGTNGLTLDRTLNQIGGAAVSLLLKVALFAVLVGLIDAVWARRRYGKQAKMSKNDVRDEARQQEVNPHVKGAIRSRQFALSRSRMIQAIAQADVVLANPTHLAVALIYTPGSAAPVVVAKGAGSIAARIKAEAVKHDVVIIENKPLARAIFSAADIGDTIPAELFRAVAEVLAAIYATRKRRGQPMHRVPTALTRTGARPSAFPGPGAPPRRANRPRPARRRRKIALPRSSE